MADIFELLKRISAKREEPAKGIDWIIAGLGNPGREYAYTRHNTGFLCMGVIARKIGTEIGREKFRSLTGRAEIGGRGVLLQCPLTYMNLSGEAIRDAAAFYHVPPERILVIVDDVNLPVGKMRFRTKGTDGGHNGLKNIIYQLQSDAFPRIRIGVGAKPEGYDLMNWVLSRFSDGELEALGPLFSRVYDSLDAITDGRTDEAMRIINSAAPPAGKTEGN